MSKETSANAAKIAARILASKLPRYTFAEVKLLAASVLTQYEKPEPKARERVKKDKPS